jgi:hypothetical protein
MATAGDRLYLGYVAGACADGGSVSDGATGASGVGVGLLVVAAADGAVLADHALEGRSSEWAMAAEGDQVWFATGLQNWGDGGPPRSSPVTGEGATSSQVLSGLWEATGTDAPRLVERYEDELSIAVVDEALWVRSATRLERRDVRTGELEVASSDGIWSSDGVVAAGGKQVWATEGTDLVDVDAERATPGKHAPIGKEDLGKRRLLVAGTSVLAVDGWALTYREADGAVERLVLRGAGVIGADAGQGRYWLATVDDDPGTALVTLLTIDASTGDRRTGQVSLLGERPLVAALDDGTAVVCVQAVRTSDDQVATAAGLGSDCRRVTQPTGSDGSAWEPPGTVPPGTDQGDWEGQAGRVDESGATVSSP